MYWAGQRASPSARRYLGLERRSRRERSVWACSVLVGSSRDPAKDCIGALWSCKFDSLLRRQRRKRGGLTGSFVQLHLRDLAVEPARAANRGSAIDVHPRSREWILHLPWDRGHGFAFGVAHALYHPGWSFHDVCRHSNPLACSLSATASPSRSSSGSIRRAGHSRR